MTTSVAPPLAPVLTAAEQDQIEAAELQSWLVGNARSIRPVARVGLMGWALAALKANPALAELHILEEVCAFYANDEDTFNREGGEPFGSIPTEVGMKARQARERFIEREERANSAIELKRYNSLESGE